MKALTWRTRLVMFLLAASLLFYLINFLIFRDLSFMLKLLTLQLAFIPISVILITIFLNALLVSREKHARLEKLRMVIGAFFSEVGNALLKTFCDFDPCRDEICQGFIIDIGWSEREFAAAHAQARNYEYGIEIQKDNLENLRSFLIGKRNFLLRLLENPNLLEHESFTDLLWAIFHLTDELSYREDFKELPPADYQHLTNDLKRAYGLLVSEWIYYMRHLRDNYPYLYSLAIRTNPLNPKASPEVREIGYR
jgi:hypothetical protein